MKAFLFDLINKLQRTSNILDAKAILCNKTWRVFSDSGDKEVYIFMEDGKLIMSVNGCVEMGTWMYIPANQSLVITGKQNYLVHPVICNDILALIVDGTNQCAFLLDDTKREVEAIKSLQSISTYISSNINNTPKIITSTSSSNESTSHFNPTAIHINEPKYVFGPNGQRDGDSSCAIDLRQLNRSGYPFVRGKYSCDFVNVNKIFILCAYSSDCDENEHNFTFKIELLRGTFHSLSYHDKISSFCAVVWVSDEKNFWGSVKRWTKHVDFYQNNKLIKESTWFELYGDKLREDIGKFNKELVPLLGIDCIINLFRNNVDPYWYP